MVLNKIIAGIIVFVLWGWTLNADDLPENNRWCYNKTAAGYLELKSRSLRFRHLGFKGDKEWMITDIQPIYFSCGSWNTHSVPHRTEGLDHVPARFNQFLSITGKNPVIEFMIRNEQFDLKRRYSLLPGTNIFKLELEWRARRNNFITSLCLSYKPAAPYTLKSQNGDIQIYTEGSGRKGFAVFTDQTYYRNRNYGAVLKKNTISLPAYNKILIPKDTVIRMTAYFALFKEADPDEAVLQAKRQAFGKDGDKSFFPWKPLEKITTASPLQKDSGNVVWRLAPELAVENGFVPSGDNQNWQLSATGNEFIADQLVITPQKNLTSLELKLADFKGPGNTEISAKQFRIEAVEAVPRSYPANWHAVYGSYMDRLLTVLPKTLDAGKNSVFLISGRVPSGQKPGEYSSKLTIRSNEFNAAIPVKLTIRNFSLPEEPFFYGDFLISGGGWANKFSQTPKEDAQFCRQDLRSLRIHPAKSLTVPMTPEGKLKGDPAAKLLKEMQRDGMQRFRINGVYRCGRYSRKFKSGSPEMDDAMTKFALATCQALDKYGLSGRSLWQLGDECHVPEYLDMQIHYSKLTGKVAPSLRRFATINGYNPKVAELIRHTDIIVPQSDIYFSRIKPNIDLKGKEVWTYDNAFMNTGIRQTVVRGIAWRSFRFGFTGYHQWCVNAWPKNWHLGVENSGSIYYPPMGQETVPQRSLRLVNFALGISDYDYLTLLRDEIRSCKDRKAAAAAEKELQEIITDMIPDSWSQPEDYRKLETAKNRIGDLIEQLRKNNPEK